MTDRRRLYGTGVALVTPFDRQGKLDTSALKKLVRHVLDGGVDYLVALGTTAEVVTLLEAEKKLVLDVILETNNNQKPVVLGIGGADTYKVLHEIKNTPLDGIEAILSVTPYYNKPNQEGLKAHYTLVAEQSTKPILLYNVPGRTSVNLLAATTLALAKHPNIIGIKEANGDLYQVAEIAKNKPEDFLLISGDDMTTLGCMAYGAVGTISVIANAFPKEFSSAVHAMLDGKVAIAQNYFFQISAMVPLLFQEGNPVGIKALLEILNIGTPDVRLPLVHASEDLTKQLKSMLDKIISLSSIQEQEVLSAYSK